MAIKVAVDSCLIINLATVERAKKDPKNKIVFDLYEKFKLSPHKFKNKAYIVPCFYIYLNFYFY